MKKGLVKKGQIWQEKETGKKIHIIQKSTGNFHWTIKNLQGKKESRHLHEGTIQKFYDPTQH